MTLKDVLRTCVHVPGVEERVTDVISTGVETLEATRVRAVVVVPGVK